MFLFPMRFVYLLQFPDIVNLVLNHLSHSTLNVEAIRCFGALCLGLGALLWETTELCAAGVLNQLALALAAAPAPGTDDQARRRAGSVADIS